MSTPPPIPPIEDNELRDAVSALARSAHSLKKIIVAMQSGTPLEELFITHGDHILRCEQVIDHWRLHLGIEDEE